jgi:drug/metabolite transporter (DMT)-like permease
MPAAGIATLIALVAALASAFGNVVRQRSAQEITDEPVGHFALFGKSLRDTRWWLGSGGAIANYALLAVALGLGSVTLVTALQVSALLFALPIYARLTHHRVSRWEWIWAVSLAVALAVFVVVGDPKPAHSRGSLSAWLVVAAVTVPLLVLCVLGARVWQGRRVAAVLLAVVAGSSLAVLAVLTKGVVDTLGDGLGAVLRTPELYAWVPIALVGMIIQQSAFRAGALTASMPTVTVVEPVVASALGVMVLDETLDARGLRIVALAAAAVVVIVATWALARGKAATMSAGTGQDTAGPAEPAPQFTTPTRAEQG